MVVVEVMDRKTEEAESEDESRKVKGHRETGSVVGKVEDASGLAVQCPSLRRRVWD